MVRFSTSLAAAVIILATTVTLVAQTSFDASYASRSNGQESRSMADGTLRSSRGFVYHRRKIKIPAEADGKLTKLNIDEGTEVTKGDLLALIDDTGARLMVEQKKAMKLEAELNANNTVNREFAVSSRDVAVNEAEALAELLKKKIVSKFEKERKDLEVTKAGLQIKMSDIETKGNQIKYIASRVEEAMAMHELDKRQIQAPFDGIIEQRLAQEGEWVQAGSPIAELVEMQQLKVEADLPGIGTGDRVYAGAPCEVLVYINGNNAEPLRIPSTLGFVSTEMNGVQSYRSWAVVDNQKQNGRWVIKPGMTAEIAIK